MKHLFVYGSLLFEEVRERILTGTYEKIEAELPGYRRLAIRGETYPALVRSSISRVQGILILNIHHRDIQSLDRFEGEYYERKPVFVVTGGADRFRCETYLLRGRYKSLLAKSEWDVELFKRRHLQQFMRRYSGF